jgi:hypothetical protein
MSFHTLWRTLLCINGDIYFNPVILDGCAVVLLCLVLKNNPLVPVPEISRSTQTKILKSKCACSTRRLLIRIVHDQGHPEGISNFYSGISEIIIHIMPNIETNMTMLTSQLHENIFVKLVLSVNFSL